MWSDVNYVENICESECEDSLHESLNVLLCDKKNLMRICFLEDFYAFYSCVTGSQQFLTTIKEGKKFCLH
jgi:hypothetical protein